MTAVPRDFFYIVIFQNERETQWNCTIILIQFPMMKTPDVVYSSGNASKWTFMYVF